jgi:hypothetical protein
MDDKKVAGHRVWDPPDPIPNSEVKPRSVPGASVVFGHVNPRKLAITSNFLNMNQAGLLLHNSFPNVFRNYFLEILKIYYIPLAL